MSDTDIIFEMREEAKWLVDLGEAPAMSQTVQRWITEVERLREQLNDATFVNFLLNDELKLLKVDYDELLTKQTGDTK